MREDDALNKDHSDPIAKMTGSLDKTARESHAKLRKVAHRELQYLERTLGAARLRVSEKKAVELPPSLIFSKPDAGSLSHPRTRHRKSQVSTPRSMADMPFQGCDNYYWIFPRSYGGVPAEPISTFDPDDGSILSYGRATPRDGSMELLALTYRDDPDVVRFGSFPDTASGVPIRTYPDILTADGLLSKKVWADLHIEGFEAPSSPQGRSLVDIAASIHVYGNSGVLAPAGAALCQLIVRLVAFAGDGTPLANHSEVVHCHLTSPVSQSSLFQMQDYRAWLAVSFETAERAWVSAAVQAELTVGISPESNAVASGLFASWPRPGDESSGNNYVDVPAFVICTRGMESPLPPG